jgi:hypothetical protein
LEFIRNSACNPKFLRIISFHRARALQTRRERNRPEINLMADPLDKLILELLRAYQSGHREGWEPGPSTAETLDGIWGVLVSMGYDPNESDAAKELLPARDAGTQE